MSIPIHAKALLNVLCCFILGSKFVFSHFSFVTSYDLSFDGKEIMYKMQYLFVFSSVCLLTFPSACQPVSIYCLAEAVLPLPPRGIVWKLYGTWILMLPS